MESRSAARLGGIGCASVLALTLALAAPAWAAPPEAPAPRTSFPAAYFAAYNPITAADMVARVPGFDLRDGDDRRGFESSAGNLLINGERPTSKAAPSELLKRIPASDVIRIELLSGNDAGVDVRGQSQIVNVIAQQGLHKKGSTSFVAGIRHVQYSNRIGWTTQLSRTFNLSPHADLSVDLQSPNTLGRGVNRETLLSGTGALLGTRYIMGQGRNVSLQGSAHLGWRPTPRDTVNANLQYVPAFNSTENVQLEAAPHGALRSSLGGMTDYDNNYTLELAGDWEHRFSPGLSVKFIGLASDTSVDQSDKFDIYTAPSTYLTRTQNRTTRSGERIGRVQVKWAAAPHNVVEFGGEGAFNFRDTSLDIVSQPKGGVAVHVPVPVANARVEEVRGEVFAADIWQASPALSVEVGANYEFSRISQTGDRVQERSFNFIKPHLSATYVSGPHNTVRFSVLRDVAQLDFAEFSSAVDFVNASSIQGNPNLVPETAWKTRLEWDARLTKRTALTLAAFADRVQDVHDLVVINGFDAYGNIGDGTRMGIEARGSTPLDAVGLPDAELRFSGLYQQTRVTDPITGRKRSFSVPLERQGTAAGSPTLNAGNKDWAYLITFRDNLPAISSSWGMTLFQWAGRSEYRRAETFHYVRSKPRLDVYVETTRIRPVTVRLYVNNVFISSEKRTRTFYQTDRGTGVVTRTEIRDALGGPEGSRGIGVLVSGRF